MRALRPQARSSINEADLSVVSWLTEARNAGLQCVSYLPFVWFPEGEVMEHGASAEGDVTVLFITNKKFRIDYVE
jgi:hypothetical protein